MKSPPLREARKDPPSANLVHNRTVPRPGSIGPHRELFTLQRTIGNRAVRRLIQAKLRIGQPNDRYEQEADRVAGQVMQMPDPTLELKHTRGEVGPPCGEENIKVRGKFIQAKQAGSQTPQTSPGLETQVRSLRGGGRPLPTPLSSFFEPRFGYDFDQVRIHTGARAVEAARAVNAKAFTIGRDIVFGTGQYKPETAQGTRLLAHELMHVVQQDVGQQGGAQPQIQRQDDGPESRPSPPGPPYGVTIDLLDPLNSSVRIGGRAIPSIRDIMDGLEAILGLGRPQIDPPNTIWPPVQLSDEELERAACRVLPSLCPDTFTPLPHSGPLELSMPLTLRMPRLTQVAFHTIDHFVYASSAIPDRHRGLLDRTATDMHDHPGYLAGLVGHTDTHGDAAYNQRLSARRARAVRSYLTGRGVPADQITSVRGAGETQPRFLDDRTNWLSAARNRRVEMTIQQLIWELGLVPPLRVRSPAPAAAQIPDPRTAVLSAQRSMFAELRTYIRNTTRQIRTLAARGPTGEAWLTSDNENITSLLALLDQLIADLDGERLIIRFDHPTTGSSSASYTETADVVHLRPFTNDEERTNVAAGLIHEYTHVIQDRTMENLLRASRGPQEHTREAELRQEIEARRQGSYFIRLLLALGMDLGDPLGAELTARMYVERFERERTGSPREQAAARREIRSTIRDAYEDQLRRNAPSRAFLIWIDDSNRAWLETDTATPADLGVIPETITERMALASHLQAAVRASGASARLFAGPGGVRYNFVLFFVFYRNRKLTEFGLPRPGTSTD